MKKNFFSTPNWNSVEISSIEKQCFAKLNCKIPCLNLNFSIYVACCRCSAKLRWCFPSIASQRSLVIQGARSLIQTNQSLLFRIISNFENEFGWAIKQYFVKNTIVYCWKLKYCFLIGTPIFLLQSGEFLPLSDMHFSKSLTEANNNNINSIQCDQKLGTWDKSRKNQWGNNQH